ncbi:MAG: ribose 5-phosphate isomerase B [Balneolaceae bacterium]|jgi:ribose 5-phosphate isomerase B
MIIPIASDHAGFEAKEKIKKILEDLGHMPVDYGTRSEDSVDYPDFAVQVAEKIDEGDNDLGILVCGSGQGMCMTANKFKNVRAALVYDEDSARLSRQHNDANILCIPGRQLNDDQLKRFVKTWLETNFDGGRHQRRVNKIHDLTENE